MATGISHLERNIPQVKKVAAESLQFGLSSTLESCRMLADAVPGDHVSVNDFFHLIDERQQAIRLIVALSPSAGVLLLNGPGNGCALNQQQDQQTDDSDESAQRVRRIATWSHQPRWGIGG